MSDEKSNGRRLWPAAAAAAAAGVGAYGGYRLLRAIRRPRVLAHSVKSLVPHPAGTASAHQGALGALGVDVNGAHTKASLKAAYRARARQHHPDVGGSHDKMTALNDAWGSIKNSPWYSKLSHVMATVLRG